MFIVLWALTCEYFKSWRSRGSRTVFCDFSVPRPLLAVILAARGSPRLWGSCPRYARFRTPPQRWLQRARKVVKSHLRDLRTSTQSHIKIEHSQTLSQSKAYLFFCNSAGGGVNIKNGINNKLQTSRIPNQRTPSQSEACYFFCNSASGGTNIRLDTHHFLKKNLNACRPSEHPPVIRGGNIKTFWWGHRLQRQNLFMALKRIPRW